MYHQKSGRLGGAKCNEVVAKLSPTAWRRPTTRNIFTVEVIREMAVARIQRAFGLNQHSYRGSQDDELSGLSAQAELQSAADAIHLAILTIAHHAGDDRPGVVSRRIRRVQRHLLEASQALSRAKVYVPGIWTYSSAVIIDQDPSPEREIARLNRLTSALATRNHNILPPLPTGHPLSPEEEAQLAHVTRAVSPRGKNEQFSRAGWLIAAATTFLLAPILGPLSLIASALLGLLGLWRITRRNAPMSLHSSMRRAPRPLSP